MTPGQIRLEAARMRCGLSLPEAAVLRSAHRQRLRELHPDANGGDYSRVDELTRLMKKHRRIVVCPDCGGFKSPRCMRCGLCAKRAQFYPNALA